MKLKSKERIGSRVIKRYDSPKTPYQRLLESPYTEEEQKERLRATYKELNVVKLKKQMEKFQDKLFRLQRYKKNCTTFSINSYVRQ
ncbi:MAG: hypothetical protein PHH26_04080 [Candidatus Thermoplasmatota archaeon]|nr:hypothetical protein [Candidatus Thermoplasmatota archaeon]